MAEAEAEPANSTKSSSSSVSSMDSTTPGPAAEDTAPQVKADQLDRQLYATQYFGFTPKSFSDGIYNAISSYQHDCLHTMQEFIKEECPKYVTGKDVQKVSVKLTALFHKVIDRTFDRLESYMTANILQIPENAVLAEDQLHLQYPNAEEDHEKLQQEIADLKKKIQNAQVFNAYLKRESADLESVQQEWDDFAAELKDVFKTFKEAGVLDVKESVCFANQLAQKLSECLDRLKPLDTESSMEAQDETDEQMKKIEN